MQSKQESHTSKPTSSAAPSKDASAAAPVADTTADGGSDVTDQVNKTEHIPVANVGHVAPKGLAKELIAFNKKELSLEELRRAFETAKRKGLDPNDSAYKSVKLLISQMGDEIEKFSIKGESDEDLITFKILDQGGQQVQ